MSFVELFWGSAGGVFGLLSGAGLGFFLAMLPLIIPLYLVGQWVVSEKIVERSKEHTREIAKAYAEWVKWGKEGATLLQNEADRGTRAWLERRPRDPAEVPEFKP